MSDERPDPIEAWREVSGSAARAIGYRPAAASAGLRSRPGLASIGVMIVALGVIVGALALRPAAGPAASGPVTAAADDGILRLELTTPRGTYEPGYPIAPVASLTYLGPGTTIAVQHTTSPVQFRIEEVGGGRAMSGGGRQPCLTTNLDKGAPLAVPFGKAGSPTDDPSAGFDQAWYEDRTLTLPVGTWRIVASIDLGVEGCAPTHHLEVANVVHVVPPAVDGPVVDRADDGVFRFELSAPRRIYAQTDAIEPIATVSYLGPDDQIAIYHGGQIVGWAIEEVGGKRTMSGVMNAPCISDVIRKDTPLAFPFVKSGAIDETFDRAWFDDPSLHLPVGTWRIQAYTTIAADDGPAPSDGSFTCGTRGHGQSAAIVVTVAGDAAPSPGPSQPGEMTPSPSPTTTPSGAPTVDADPVVGSTSDATFRLDLTTPHTVYGPDDVIAPVATLTFLGPGQGVTFGHGAPAIDFRIEEIGGDRVMGGGVDDICQSTDLARGQPATFDFIKGGQIDTGFDRAWFEDPVLRLPVGRWRISAVLVAYVNQCGADADVHELTAENVIEVVEPTRPIPDPSTSTSDAATAFQIATLYETARVAGREDAWKLLSPWSQALYGSRTAFERAQADLNVLGYRRFEIGAPSRDPDLLSSSFLGARAADLAARADPDRAFVVSIRYPEVDGASGGNLDLVVAALRNSPSDWEVWVDARGS